MQTTRRTFLKLAALGSALLASCKITNSERSGSSSSRRKKRFSDRNLKGEKLQRRFENGNFLQIAMPLGGIGAGCICLNGYGGLQDFSIRNKPDTSGLPDGHHVLDAAFALLHIKGKNSTTKLVEGLLPLEKIYDQGLKGQGYRKGGYEGLPRFEICTFKGEYPFGMVTLTDPDVPLTVSITGFNPFIPLDDKNSSIPCAILEYTLKNKSGAKVDFEFSYHLSHLAVGSKGEEHSLNTVIPGKGILFHNEDHPNSEEKGSAVLAVINHNPIIKGMWFRGGWFDSISVLWREVSTGSFKPNNGSNKIGTSGRNGGSIMLKGSLNPGEESTYPIIITWYFPNCHYTAGRVKWLSQTGEIEEPKPDWRPYYVSHWKDANEVAEYVINNYKDLRVRTQYFHDALFSSTLPSYVLEAISANLAILKSPTVLMQENGNLWAWEGCFTERGCCHGTCTHVWNYAQAFPHLFPKLERTLREQELERSMNEQGHITFRAALPDGPTKHEWHAASDGQLGGIMKVYRDWHISGDSKWLKKMYPLVKKSIDYCIKVWDPKHKGVLQEPHHNTYDIEFWGPEGMCSSIYLGALAAMVAMAEFLGKSEDTAFYKNLAQKGAKFLDDKLFNGEYFEQKVTFTGLRNKSFLEHIAKVDEYSGEVDKLLKKEGPKYQYGTGCLSDGIIGAWMSKIYGIDTPQTKTNIKKSLQSIFKYNFKTDLFDYANTQRPGYAIGHEPGLLLCSWPRGGKPTLPFVYSDEVWTGIEYQVASHLIEEGFLKEGLTIVKAVRSRYDGHTRNPWNEYECGNYYARAMASYALLGSLSGFRYSAVQKTLWFGPKINTDNFKMFFSAASGFGKIKLSNNFLTIEMVEGELTVKKLILTTFDETKEIDADIIARVGKKINLSI